MFITKLTGGIGNQMFQYALGRRLSHDRKTELKLDISWFNNQSVRNFGLFNFKIGATIASPKDIASLKIKKGKINNFLGRFKIIKNPSYIKEYRQNVFNPDILSLPDNIYLDGYWQSEKYFSTIKDILRKEFVLKNELSQENIKFANHISSVESVSVHVRRGDYISLGYAILDVEYYYLAMKKIFEKNKNSIFFIFSEDFSWIYKNFNFNFPMIFINHSKKDTKEWEDLYLISRCKHHIIANSSFSWWGSWLSNNKEKIIIKPDGYMEN